MPRTPATLSPSQCRAAFPHRKEWELCRAGCGLQVLQSGLLNLDEKSASLFQSLLSPFPVSFLGVLLSVPCILQIAERELALAPALEQVLRLLICPSLWLSHIPE